MAEQTTDRLSEATDKQTRDRLNDGKVKPVIRGFRARGRQFATTLLKEKLDPGGAAAAVFVGVFIGIVPIYGFQTLAAVGLALLFRLNKPLTLASTFINNPLLQPVLVVSSVELGRILLGRPLLPWNSSALASAHLKDDLLAWVIGSIPLGVLAGGVGAAITAMVVRQNAPDIRGLRDRVRFVNGMFAGCARGDRGFVRWKLRMDRLFGLLAGEDLGSGTVADLGCGYGIALGFAAFGDSRRRLVGCDLDAHRITVARQALSPLNAELSVTDVRQFELPPAGLILILDVLQYLDAVEQVALLKRCCSALEPVGRLIFRVHDRERGLWSTITLAFDRLIFACGRAGIRPLMLPASEYRLVLENAGLEVEERRFRNLLPLAHIVFIAKRPLAEATP
jgi:uncharacterized protein (DUF2062 family)/SAM-dependent methyltransferase